MKRKTSARNIPDVTFIVVFIALSILLTACGTSGSSTNPDGSINIEVTLTDFGIESSLTEFEVGKTYRFTITNEGAIPHEFVIAEPLMEGEEHSADMDMTHEGLVVDVEEDDLPAGATVTVDVTFPVHADEALEFACHIEGHYEAGMHSPITLK